VRQVINQVAQLLVALLQLCDLVREGNVSSLMLQLSPLECKNPVSQLLYVLDRCGDTLFGVIGWVLVFLSLIFRLIVLGLFGSSAAA
jgi:hypothetical protein